MKPGDEAAAWEDLPSISPNAQAVCIFLYLPEQAMAWCLRVVLSGGESRSLWPNCSLSWGLVRDLEPGCLALGHSHQSSQEAGAALQLLSEREGGLGEGGPRPTQAFLMRTHGTWEFCT